MTKAMVLTASLSFDFFFIYNINGRSHWFLIIAQLKIFIALCEKFMVLTAALSFFAQALLNFLKFHFLSFTSSLMYTG